MNLLVEELFFNPEHQGIFDVTLADFFAVTVGNSKAGPFATIYVHQPSSDKIIKACFQARGNPYLIAGVEWLCKTLENNPINLEISRSKIIQILNIPNNKYSTAIFIEQLYDKIKEKGK